ncbi:unnamed protein product [Blepharisma stoltei]|uniref:Calcineurin-like phosphoesterase domain-containing protein n=1 Tax=Blepharisma stoltei TaxID=1481888 RepID=A0AAU9K3M1_9CILI|nr:unnamed protein product [Blepharisma stoltei]
MELNILVVTDSHEGYEELKIIVEKTEPDIILHAGDFSRGYDDLPSVKRQLEILEHLRKPIYWVPGNHDHNSFILHMNPLRKFSGDYCEYLSSGKSVLLGDIAHEIAPGLFIAGLGGAPPSFVGDKERYYGKPYQTKTICDWAVRQVLRPQLNMPGQYIILTHFGPLGSDTTKSFKDGVESGNQGLTDLLYEFRDKILINFHGHQHRGKGIFIWNGIPVVNPGPSVFGNYCEINIRSIDNRWEIVGIKLLPNKS